MTHKIISRKQATVEVRRLGATHGDGVRAVVQTNGSADCQDPGFLRLSPLFLKAIDRQNS
jgi:hypothetical protein